MNKEHNAAARPEPSSEGPLRFAVLGAGFWAGYQLAAWQELTGAECVAVCDPDRNRSETLARARNVPGVYADPEALLAGERLDFVDIVTPAETHRPLVEMAAARGLPVICQKPMATTLAEAEQMAAACHAAGVPFFVHENWRWQRPIREIARVLESGILGHPFRARLTFCSSFPVFANQPFLATLPQFLLTDMGSHILDSARFLFGEADTLFCQTHRAHKNIAGEDVATVMMAMKKPNAPADAATAVVCEMSYASRLENERFPETYICVEAERGSVTLGPDYRLAVTTEDGTHSHRVPPPRYHWADPAYDLVQSSMVPCCADFLEALRSAGALPETHGEDNLRTVRLVFAAYESARTGKAVTP